MNDDHVKSSRETWAKMSEDVVGLPIPPLDSPGVTLNRVGWRLAVLLGKVNPDTDDKYEGDIDELLTELEARAVISQPLDSPTEVVVEELDPGFTNRTRPEFTFDFEEDGSLSIQSAVFQALGYASMCWEETPTGIFDSTAAKQCGDTLITYLMDKM